MLIVHSPVVGLNLPPAFHLRMVDFLFPVRLCCNLVVSVKRKNHYPQKNIDNQPRCDQKVLSAKKSLIISPDVIKKCYPQKIIDNQYRCPVFNVFDVFNVFVSFKE